MAKQHIKYLVRQVAMKYQQLDKELTEIGFELQDVMLSPEEQKTFSTLKAGIDNQLALLSVSLSAAAQGKLSEVLSTANAEKDSYIAPIKQAIDNLADSDIPDDVKLQTQQLVAMYTRKVQLVTEKLMTLDTINFFASFPRNKKKQRKLLYSILLNYLDDPLLGLDNTPAKLAALSLDRRLDFLYTIKKPLAAVDEAFKAFKNYVAELTSDVDTSDTEVDDLSE